MRYELAPKPNCEYTEHMVQDQEFCKQIAKNLPDVYDCRQDTQSGVSRYWMWSIGQELRKWSLKGYDKKKARALALDLGLFETTAGLLMQRGIQTSEEAQSFLSPSLSKLHSPFLMSGVRAAVDRIKRARERGEKLLIFGDYDVDGTTATAVLQKALQKLQAKVDYYIPERLVEGSGLKESIIDRAHNDGYSVIISVDCGIKAHTVARYAQERGIDLIITDHHVPEGELPSAFAVINPKRKDCHYPYKNLAGCGVAFKLAQALISEELSSGDYLKTLEELIEIAAIGTIADMVPLTGENRIIVKYGLQRLSRRESHGLKALLEISGIGSGRAITCNDISYRVAPRINAVGRMGGASAAVDIFSAPDTQSARRLAREMNIQNYARQKTEAEILQEVINRLEGCSDRVIVLAGERWHRGIIGIAASKVLERTKRPSIVISVEEGTGYGSGRSGNNFALLEALRSCSDLLSAYGGHPHAAGLTLPTESIEPLRARLNESAELFCLEEGFTQVIEIDAELSFAELNTDLMTEIALLEPFGTGNPSPIFLAEGVEVVNGPRVVRDQHLKFSLHHRGRTLSAVWWKAHQQKPFYPQAETLSLAFSVDEKSYANPSNIQLAIRDMKG